MQRRFAALSPNSRLELIPPRKDLMPKRFILGAAAAALAAVVLVAAGCGGSSRNKAYANDKVAYAAAVSSICLKVKAEQTAIGVPKSLTEWADKADDLKKSFDDGISRVEKLQAPDEVSSQADEFISVSKQQAAKIDDLKKAAKENNQDEFNSVVAEFNDLNAKSDEAAKAIGAKGCVSTAQP